MPPDRFMTNGVQTIPCVGALPEGFREIDAAEYHRLIAAREAEIAAQVRAYAEQSRAALAPIREKLLAGETLTPDEVALLLG
jgi:uncharacterized coiled-coil DUF342 family protein